MDKKVFLESMLTNSNPNLVKDDLDKFQPQQKVVLPRYDSTTASKEEQNGELFENNNSEFTPNKDPAAEGGGAELSDYSGSSSDEMMDDDELLLDLDLGNHVGVNDEQSKLEGLLLDSANSSHKIFPPTYLVIRLSPTIKPEAITWFTKKISGKKQDGGAELLVRCEPFNGKPRDGLILHVTASKLKFLECAEYLELKKVDCNGVLREFCVSDLDNFLYRDVHLDNLLSPAEKQMIVVHELENIRAMAGEDIIPGYPAFTLHRGQSILEVYLEQELVLTTFPLHDAEQLEKLGAKWYWAFFQAQPFEDIRKYFGDGLALYFSFLGFYTSSLLLPAVLGVLQYFLSGLTSSSQTLVGFCVFNILWVTLSQEMWKRTCSEQAYVWGNLRMTKWEEPRSNFKGRMAIDPVTGRYQPKYPWWKTAAKAYCVSLPIVLLCLLGAFWVMLYSFWAEEYLIESQTRHGSKLAGWFVMVPSILYAALVWISNFYYRKFANFLTEWENHRTQGQFERHRVTKLVLFEFVNNFMSLFYIAFYIRDLDMLRYQVTVMLIIMQFINHFQEALLPLVIKKGYNWAKVALAERFPKYFGDEPSQKDNETLSESISSAVNVDTVWSPSGLGLQCLEPSDQRIANCKQEIDLDPYEGTFDDYLEMFIQFGYVYLFSAVYPLAGVWAVVNNFLEIRADAFKLCKVFQRPIAKRVKDIGAWQIAFEIMGGIAVMTNCAILSLSPTLKSHFPTLSAVEWVFLFVVIEHFLLGVKCGLSALIPDVPSWVKIALARMEYQSRQALKNEQAFKSRRQLTRRFKTIHVARKKNLAVNDNDSFKSATNLANATSSSAAVIVQRKVRKTSGSGSRNNNSSTTNRQAQDVVQVTKL